MCHDCLQDPTAPPAAGTQAMHTPCGNGSRSRNWGRNLYKRRQLSCLRRVCSCSLWQGYSGTFKRPNPWRGSCWLGFEKTEVLFQVQPVGPSQERWLSLWKLKRRLGLLRKPETPNLPATSKASTFESKLLVLQRGCRCAHTSLLVSKTLQEQQNKNKWRLEGKNQARNKKYIETQP